MKCLFVNKNWFDLNILYPLDKNNWTEQQTLPLEAFTVKKQRYEFCFGSWLCPFNNKNEWNGRESGYVYEEINQVNETRLE